MANRRQTKNLEGSPDFQSLLVHREGCLPLKPCATCKLFQFARQNLQGDKFEAFLTLIADAEGKSIEGQVEVAGVSRQVVLDDTIDVLRLSVRAHNCLKNDNLLTIRQVLKKDAAELLRIPNFGPRSLSELAEQLGFRGFKVGQEEGKDDA